MKEVGHPSRCPDMAALGRWMREALKEEVMGLVFHHRGSGGAVHRWVEECATCSRHLRTLELWQEELQHPDPELVARERPTAWRLWKQLEGAPTRKLKRKIRREHLTWGMGVKFLIEARAASATSPGRGILLAEVGLGIGNLLDIAGYQPQLIADFLVRAWSTLGNARRVAGQLRQADLAFAEARDALPYGTGDLLVRAHYCDLLGSLRKDQRWFPEADATLAEALALYAQVGRWSLVAKIRLMQGDVSVLRGNVEEAMQCFTEAQSLIHPERDPFLFAHCQHHLVAYLVQQGQFEEAALRLPMARKLWSGLGHRRNLLMIRWEEGRILQATGEVAAAEAAYREVARGFETMGIPMDLALVGLDRALLAAEMGNEEEMYRLLQESHGVLVGEALHRECTAALFYLRRACEERRVSRSILISVASFLKAHRDGSHRPFDAPSDAGPL